MPTPRKPLALHKLQGTVPEHVSAPSPTFAAGRPKMPADLSPVAQAEWKRITSLLNKRGTLTKADAPALEVYVRTFACWKAASILAEAHPVTEVSWVGSDGIERTKVVEHPASKMAARDAANLRAFYQQFSCTPASREKTRPAPPPPPKDQFPEGSCGAILAAEAAAENEVPEEEEAP